MRAYGVQRAKPGKSDDSLKARLATAVGCSRSKTAAGRVRLLNTL